MPKTSSIRSPVLTRDTDTEKKTWFINHKGVNFEAQNALKLTYEHLYFPKNSGTLVKRGRGGAREGRLRHCPWDICRPTVENVGTNCILQLLRLVVILERF